MSASLGIEVVLDLQPRVVERLDDLVATGLFGFTREDAAERLLCEALRARATEGWISLNSRGPDFPSQDGRSGTQATTRERPDGQGDVEASTASREPLAREPDRPTPPETPAATTEQPGAAPPEPPGDPVPPLDEPKVAPVLTMTCRFCKKTVHAGKCAEEKLATGGGAPETCHFCGFKSRAGIWVDTIENPPSHKVWRCAACETGARKPPAPAPTPAKPGERLCPHEDCRRPLRVDNTKGQCAKCQARGRSVDRARATAAAR